MAKPFKLGCRKRTPGRRWNYIDVNGQVFGKLTVIKQSTKFYWGGSLWDCRCECGAVVQRSAARLRTELREYREGKRRTPPACPDCVRRLGAELRKRGKP
jgi:hypothetical protein